MNLINSFFCDFKTLVWMLNGLMGIELIFRDIWKPFWKDHLESASVLFLLLLHWRCRKTKVQRRKPTWRRNVSKLLIISPSEMKVSVIPNLTDMKWCKCIFIFWIHGHGDKHPDKDMVIAAVFRSYYSCCSIMLKLIFLG
jgi:hypothetical protein